VKRTITMKLTLEGTNSLPDWLTLAMAGIARRGGTVTTRVINELPEDTK